MRVGRIIVLAIVLVAFTAFSLWVTITEGYFGFLRNARDERWGLQVLLDLVIAMTLLSRHMFGKGREIGVPVWPYLISLPFLGSIGALAFYVHVELVRPNGSDEPSPPPVELAEPTDAPADRA